jgi:hypothetical protein
MVTIDRESSLLRRTAQAREATKEDKIISIVADLGQHWSHQTQELPKAPDPNILEKREVQNQTAIIEHIGKKERETAEMDTQSIIETQPMPQQDAVFDDEETKPSASTRRQRDESRLASLKRNHGEKPINPYLTQTFDFRDKIIFQSEGQQSQLEDTQPSESTDWIATRLQQFATPKAAAGASD